MTLPKIPDGKDWSEATWRAGLDEAVRLGTTLQSFDMWQKSGGMPVGENLIIAHATTLLDAGIVKPVVSEAALLLEKTFGGNAHATTVPFWKCPVAIAVIQSALDKARNGQ